MNERERIIDLEGKFDRLLAERDSLRAEKDRAELVRDQAVEALRAIVRADDAKWRERWRSRGAIYPVALTESISRASKFLDGVASTVGGDGGE